MNTKIIFAGFLFVLSFSLMSCNKDEDNTPDPQNIVQLASSNSNLSTLVAAVQRAGLVDVLSGNDNFTVFAPTNTAFDNFLTTAGFANLEAVPTDVLRNILLNHVVAGTVRSTDLTTGYFNSQATFGNTTNNLSLYINTASGVRINGVSTVSTPDVAASNGIVHIVDAVIGLPTITTFAQSNNDFSILVSALTRSDLSANYAQVLSGEGPFTVFAPTNAAFQALLTELGLTALEDIPAELLEAVLTYHVVGAANVRAENLTNGQSVNTLQGQNFTVNLGTGATITDARGRNTNIIATNVQGSNGVVHVIDRVILPGE
jgi:uncharacterized surface protein with fasciclin (FAS1) repeats